MARPQKRQRPDDPSRDRPSPKRVKSTRKFNCSNYPPKFWDNLSKVWLTSRALRELDRRNSTIQPGEPKAAAGGHCDDIPRLVTEGGRGLSRFARQGGPDLFDIRGFPRIMSSGGSSQTRPTESGTKATSVSFKSGKTTAYADDFEQHLIDHGIYPMLHEHPDARPTPKPNNLGDIRRRLTLSRASLSPSQFDESKFDDFQRKNIGAVSEKKVMRTVVPVLGGNTDILNEEDALFTRLTAITDDTIPKPMPHYFDGARREDIHGAVKGDLKEIIIPTGHVQDPVLPNFFLEAKGHKGGADVARRQACYDGAIGARAVQSLQNYRRNEPMYDGNAYTISSTYHAGTGTLQMYAHHPTKPATPGGRPEYHMTQVGAYAMTHNRDACVDGLKAFRNGREWAKEQRDSSIETANARVRECTEVPCTQKGNATQAQQNEGLSPRKFVDCEESVESQDHCGSPLQQGPANYNDDGTSQDNDGPGVSQDLHVKDETQDQSQESALLGVESPTSFATTFTSSFSTRSKRARKSQSPPPNPRQYKKQGSVKSQTRAGTSRGISELSTKISTSTSAAQSKPVWTWSERCTNWYHLRKDGSRKWYKGEQKKQ